MSNMNTPKQRFSYEDFDVMKVRIASPERIREWSRGEVKKPETINYRTLKPERDGLFCEKIFGPTKDWECYCGKYKRVRYKGVVCDRCGVEVTKSKVRRERMGHIELAAPVSHIWYLKGVPSRMGLLIDVSPRNLEKVVYFAAYIVLDEGDKKLTKLEYKQVLSENEYREKCREIGKKLLLEEKCISQSEYEKKCKHEDEKVVKKEFKKVLSDSEYEYECENKGMSAFRVGMGAEAIKELLEAVDLDEEVKKLKREISKSTGQKKVRAIKRMETVSAFQKSGNEPSWMIMDCVPVIPPELRPMVQLDGGRFATSDLNDLYRRIINRNNRLRRLLELRAPEIIIRNEKRMLQEAVDSLIDNGRRGRAVTGASNRPLKSLSDMLKGKQGRFRQNLLGKRVDYSGRSVIVVGPELKFYQCGLPKQMAIELFKPFVMKELVQRGMAHNIKSAKKMIDRGQDAIWDILEEVIREHPVMLNRAPTLHRLSIQAFEPVLVEGKAIKLHPLACTPFNADFDGDQMAVHVPLTYEAQTEARFLMLSANNLLKLSDGSPVNVPTQDMVLGSYYLTTERDGMVGEGKIFKDENEAIRAYFDKVVDIEAKIKLRRKVNFTSVNKKGEEVTEEVTKIIDTTVGKIIFNEIIPQDLGFVDRTDREKVCDYEINEQVSKKVLGKIIRKAIQTHDSAIVVEMLDNIKALGYHYSTISGMTISASDVLIPEEKQDRIDATTERVNKIKAMYEKGLMTKQEKHDKIVAEWSKTTDQLSEDVMKTFGPYNHIKIMADSGARGSKQQIKQLAGMRGNMAATSGEIVELPIKSCFKEGLTTLEYFLSAHGSRKSLSDTALKTADSGYLTRRLVDVAQDITIKEADCCADGLHEPNYKVVSALMEGKELIEGLSDRIAGRWSIDTIVNPETKKVIVEADHMITAKQADEIESCGITEVKIRTALTCRSRDGVCAKCYGADMANGKESRVGEAVGIIAAQSIGEPGTQLSMETKHLGGIAGKDITQGLPRVEEIFETRKPKGDALISEIGGKIKIKELENDNKQVIVKNKEQTIEYDIRHGAKLAVEDGQTIEAGDKLTEGSINPHDILEINGPERVQAYIIKEIQRAYRLQGVDINDKHVEIICRQMLKKVRIEEQGDSEHLPGVVLDLKEIEDINEELIAKKKKPAVYKQMLLGITKSSLATSSFLSAASFQETTRVLTEAAISGRADHLRGLKENIILGKIIPAGTGMKQYNSVDAKMKEVEEVVEELEAEE